MRWPLLAAAVIGGVFLRPKPMQMPEMGPEASDGSADDVDAELEEICSDPV